MTHPFRSLLPALLAAVTPALLLAGCQTVAPATAHGLTAQQIAVLKDEGFVETPGGWALSMNDRLLFATDDSAIDASKATRITRMATALLGVGIDRARIEGYTDSTGTEQHNDQLSTQRAQTVADVMIRCGFAAANLAVQGLGERNPVDSNRTAAGREQNRRVVVLISAIG
jgi:outer membrane protein OmpA-like peptidoglycan-associated protein